MMEIQFQGKINEDRESLWPIRLVVPKEIVDQVEMNFGSRRVRCKIEGNESFPAALMPDGRGGFYIMLNKERERLWQLRMGMVLSVALKPETSEFGMPMSAEMAAVLESDPDALGFFKALTPGKQRSLIYLITKIKSEQLRLTKSIILARYLRDSAGQLDYKALNVAFKEGF